MRLLNADGSRSEVSGNGVRCLAAWIASQRGGSHGDRSTSRPTPGTKRLELLASEDGRYTFRAAMGQPEQIALEPIDVGGRTVEAVTLRVGNPQCVVLGAVTEARLHTLASALAVHPHFPEGTNVELAHGRGARSRPDPDLGARRRADRGVGHRRVRRGGGGDRVRRRRARRAGRVPGRRAARRVAGDGLFLTGWAEIIAEAHVARGGARSD